VVIAERKTCAHLEAGAECAFNFAPGGSVQFQAAPRRMKAANSALLTKTALPRR